MSTQHDATEDSTGPESPGELLHDLTAFRRDALVAIAELQAGPEACYGLAIKEYLDAVRGTDISRAQLYDNLNWLADRGFVDKGQIDRRTNSYKLTDTGYDVLVARHDRIARAINGVSGQTIPLAGGDA